MKSMVKNYPNKSFIYKRFLVCIPHKK